MSTQALLDTLAGRDIHVTADGGDLLVDTPRGALTLELRSALLAHKPDLLAILRQKQGSQTRGVRSRHDALAWRQLAARHDRTAELVERGNPEAAMAWRRDAARCRMLAKHGTGPWDLPADWRLEFEERAAIREYEGGQAREHAEAEAFGEIVRRMHMADGIHAESASP